jgi:hypothetical protein
MIFYMFLIFMNLCCRCYADAFKINDHSTEFKQAIAQDSRGFYYRNALDYDLTSASTNTFNFGRADVPAKVSTQIDFNKTIAHQVQDMTAMSIQQVSETSPLMLYQYSSPAGADLWKYYNTLAYLKLNIFYKDLRDLENGLDLDLNSWRDQSQIECLKSKLAHKKANGLSEYDGDLIDLMVSCRDQKLSSNAPFGYLKYSSGSSMNIFEKITNKFNYRGDKKDELLEILPQWQIDPKGFNISHPQKLIGEVLAVNRQDFIDQLNTLLDNYHRDKAVNAEALENFNLPGVPFTEQNVRNLFLMSSDQRMLAVSHIASQAALVKTMGRYEQSIEWLQRALSHPSLEEPYKEIIRKGIDFLKQETASLTQQGAQLKEYAHVMGSLLDAGDQERLKIIADLQITKQGKADNERTFEP